LGPRNAEGEVVARVWFGSRTVKRFGGFVTTPE